MSLIQDISQKYPSAGYWHQQYPWFSIGHLVKASNHKEAADFEETAQKAAIFFNNIPRLHWHIHQPESIDLQQLLTATNPIKETTATPAALSDSVHSASASNATTSSSVFSEIAAVATPEIRFSENAFTAQESADNNDEETNESMEESTFGNSPFSQSLAQVAQELKRSSGSNEELLIQPSHQHTVDYFASQGINLEEEPAQDEQFGRQLKTFTSWLRQMKPLANNILAEDNLLVETHAAHSLQQEDVLTESMADVLLKQGKKQHAIDVLEKLRLLHPQKTHYFASRIEQIKHL